MSEEQLEHRIAELRNYRDSFSDTETQEKYQEKIDRVLQLKDDLYGF